MSILLEALRKSERQQRKGSPPDIHAEDLPVETPRGSGSRSWVLWCLGAIVVLVLGIYGWKVWQAYQVPTAAPEFTDEPPAAVPAPGATSPADTPTADSTSTGPAAQADLPPAAGAAPPANAGPRLNRQPRSPVETLSSDEPLQAAKSASRATPGQTRPAVAAGDSPASTPSTPSTPSAAPAPAQRTAAQRRREARLAALQQAVETTGVPEEERLSPQRGARPDRAADDGAISFWQLPEMTRNALPELRINVMVYDEDPSKRFIIMGGKRYGEGADIGGNLELETVQRDRALFRYGAYLFYVKQ